MFILDNILIFARLLLTCLFFMSGIAKLSNQQGFYETLINFGIPRRIHKIIGFSLPWVELILAIGLLLPFAVWWVSVASSILMIFFTLLISYNLVKKRHPPCNCFGVDNKPIDAFTLLRNIALVACSLLLVFYGMQYEHANIAVWLSDMTNATGVSSLIIWLLVVIVISEGWMILKLIQQNGRLLLKIDNIEYRLDAAGISDVVNSAQSKGLQVGTKAPAFSLPNLHGDLVSLEKLLQIKKPIVLVFSDPGCGPCVAMMPSLIDWNNEVGSDVTLVLISRGLKEVNIGKYGELNLDYVLLQTDREIAEQYKATLTPSAVRIDSNGLIDSPIVFGEVAIAALVYEPASHLHSDVTNENSLSPAQYLGQKSIS